MERPTDEPEPSDLELLFGDITGFLKETKGITLTADDLATRSQLGRQFLVSNLNLTMVYGLDRREVVRELPNMLTAWKKATRRVGYSQKAMELAETLTLAKLAEIAGEASEKTKENMVDLILGSIQYQRVRLAVEYWSIIQEISKEAAEEEERRNP